VLFYCVFYIYIQTKYNNWFVSWRCIGIAFIPIYCLLVVPMFGILYYCYSLVNKKKVLTTLKVKPSFSSGLHVYTRFGSFFEGIITSKRLHFWLFSTVLGEFKSGLWYYYRGHNIIIIINVPTDNNSVTAVCCVYVSRRRESRAVHRPSTHRMGKCIRHYYVQQYYSSDTIYFAHIKGTWAI